MKESEAVQIAQCYVNQLIQNQEVFPCEFRCARFISKDQPHSGAAGYWVTDFPFTVEEAAGHSLHVIVDDVTAEASILESLCSSRHAEEPCGRTSGNHLLRNTVAAGLGLIEGFGSGFD